MLNGTLTEGGCSKICAPDVPQPLSLIFLIPLRLSHANRPPPCRAKKIGEDESDPPENRGVMWPR